MRRNIFLMNMAAVFLWMSMYSYTPILPAYGASLGANVVMIGIVAGAYGIMQIILRIPLGILTDKLRADRLLLVIGFSVLTLSAVLFLTAQNVNMLIFARGMAGAAAAWWVVVCASFAHYHREDEQVKAQGVISASGNIGKVAASLLCAVVAQAFSFYAAFVLSLAAALVGLVLMFGLKEQKPAAAKQATLKEQLLLLKNKELLAFSVLALLGQMLCFATATTFTPVAAEKLGADGMGLGMLTLVFFLFTSVFSLFAGTKLFRKMGGVNAVALAFFVGAASCVPLLYQNMLSLYVAQALAGICYGVTTAALSGFALHAVAPHQRGAATGILQSIFGIGIFLGPVVMGVLIDGASFDAAYWTMCAVMLASGALCYALIPKRYNAMT